MKVGVIHAGNEGFFPRYYKAISAAVKEKGDHIALFAPRSGRNLRNPLPGQVTWGTRLNWLVHNQLHKLTGMQDVFSCIDTLSLIAKLRNYNPDVLHLNVVNDKIINMPILVRYINRHNIPVVWTMHDCRAFTGQCPYFDEVDCDKWRTGCGHCPQLDTWIDNTHITWKIHRKYHAGINNLTIVTPSQWLANFVKRSFFRDKHVTVIYNGVDIDCFLQPLTADVRAMYQIPEEKKIILGCAINWEERKGLVYFNRLAGRLPASYQIVLVGNIPEDKVNKLRANNIICTGRTKTFAELVAWYQAASVLCNPTLSDNFPTVNIEALASGTPVVTFKTGGSPEAVDSKTGIVVAQGDVEALRKAVVNVAENRDVYTSENCKSRSLLFSNKQYDKYIDLFHQITKL